MADYNEDHNGKAIQIAVLFEKFDAMEKSFAKLCVEVQQNRYEYTQSIEKTGDVIVAKIDKIEQHLAFEVDEIRKRTRILETEQSKTRVITGMIGFIAAIIATGLSRIGLTYFH